MNTPDSAQLTWHKSSFSGGANTNCVEVAQLPDGSKALRDSKNPDGPVLHFTAPEWTAFVTGIEAGELY